MRYARFRPADAGVPPSSGRRVLDVVLSTVLLAMVLPLLLLLAVLVRLTSPGPALFRQVRLGQGGRPFELLKLRSMRCDASGPDVTPAGDARVTPLGRFLRRTSLDELPQLLNVLRGEMTLVGPRPETPGLAARYPESCRWVLRHRPGLTGPVQLALRDADAVPPGADPETYYLTHLVPERVRLDATFLRDPTPGSAVRLIGRTVRYLLTGSRPQCPGGA